MVKKSRLGLAGPLVFIALTLVAVGSFGLTSRASSNDEEQILHERGGEVAALLGSSTRSVGATLGLLGEVYAGRGEAGPGFTASARSLLQGSTSAIGVVEAVDGGFVVRAVEGTGVVVGDRLEGDRAVLAERALEAKNLVSALIVDPSGGSLLLWAFGRDDGLVVFQDSAVSPSTPTPSTPTSPFRELNVALYRSSTAEPSQLVVSTTAETPLSGTVDERMIQVGAEQWLLVTSARSPLTSSQARAVPWIVLGVGLAAAIVAAGVVTLLTRRRAYALDLVDQQTAELRKTLLELESARVAADSANRAKSQFLSRMSHELRTPLNAVLGFAQILELGDLNGPSREAVSHILKGGNHLLDLINEVLDISRIESGDIALSIESVLASEVVAESIDLMRPLAMARSITIIADSASCNDYIFADRQRLKQIMLNLLSNAVKYNRVGGKVTVSCEMPTTTTLRLKVADTGAGISDDDLGLLFVPFERLAAHLTDIEGTGIGLALSRRLAEAMGGALGVDSILGQGSTFWIELPLVEGAVERYDRLNVNVGTQVLGAAPSPLRSVLYIEDNIANLTLVQRILAQRTDIEILPAMQGRLGFELARLHQPVLILLDLHLPDISGEVVLQQLRDDPLTSSIPVVILSADATPGKVQRLQAAGASAYLTKPLNVRELLRIVEELVPESNASPPRPT